MNAYKQRIVRNGKIFSDRRGVAYSRLVTVVRNKAGDVVRHFTQIVKL